jgi:thiamine-monophosphate kinase
LNLIGTWIDAGTLARLAGVAHARCDVSDGLVADLGHICEGSGVSAVIEVTALPLSPPARRIIAKDPDLVPRLAGAADEYELAFTSPPDASPAIEGLSPELALRSPQPAQSRGRKAGVRLVDPARKRLPITAFGWQHFWC